MGVRIEHARVATFLKCKVYLAHLIRIHISALKKQTEHIYSVYTIIILSTLASLRFLQSFLYLSSAITFWLLMLVFTITLSLLISYFTFFWSCANA